ncbi:uncharacterized protein LOC131691128 [Topomyia yanbarensis]|uniref:uncharacterized protein LOC131691128 n=1 Tax=Topomyia yanbarensis TaxID=2498891 RepID=UPI00273B9049|nr:uncharacterized protein LOC131691128 [Topomyia yanbarensis]
MVLYKLMVVHWSIFTLFTQLVFCASAFSNSHINHVNHKSICDDDSVQYVHETGPDSSLVLNLYPDKNKPFCKRQFHAPESHSFYVRLQRIPSLSSSSQQISQQIGSSRKYGSKKISNTTDSCSLSISHSLHGEVLPPWRLDPCELEALSSGDEPMRLLQGRLNIVWNHLGNRPGYRLLVTVIGNGPPCLEDGKHSCLEVDDVPLLCISKELVCDGVRHCPSPVNAFSDEDSALCSKMKDKQLTENPVQMVFRKYIQTTFKSFFYANSTEVPSREDTTTADEESVIEVIESQTKIPTKQHKSTLTGLSKYGPWGYLFLGMLLCGGALLVCGLWECCCRSHKPEAPDIVDNESPSVYLESGLNNTSTSSASGTVQTLPPYEDLDPPPAYSVLFPNQKSSDNLPSLLQPPMEQEPTNNSDPAQSGSSGTSVNTVHIQTQTGQ